MGNQGSQTMPQTLSGPVVFMVNKWGQEVVGHCILWHTITKMKFPLMGTFSLSKLQACRELLEQYERTAGKKRKHIDWDTFRKWEREAESRSNKQTRALLYKDESEEDKRRKRLKKTRADILLPPPYASTAPVQQNQQPDAALQPPGQHAQPQPPLPENQLPHPPGAPILQDPAGGLYAEAVHIANMAAAGGQEEEEETGDEEEEDEEEVHGMDEDEEMAAAVEQLALVAEKRRRKSERRGSERKAPRSPAQGVMMTRRGRGKQQLFPLIPYPNPLPRPVPPALQEDIDNYTPTVHVQRNWTPDELNEVVKELPDPKVDVIRWCAATKDLIEMYSPSARELESVFRKVFGLKWPRLRGDFNIDGERADIVTGQLENQNGLFDRVKAAFPVRTDWPRIHMTKQLLDETCDNYRNRMEECFQKYCGVENDNPAYTDLLKTALINGLLPSVHNRVMTSCVGWESRPLHEVWTHAQHAERHVLSQDNEKKKKLETAQLMFFENLQQGPKKEGRTEPQKTDKGQGKRESYGGRNRGRGQTPGDTCHRCGQKGHWKDTCPKNSDHMAWQAQAHGPYGGGGPGPWGWGPQQLPVAPGHFALPTPGLLALPAPPGVWADPRYSGWNPWQAGPQRNGTNQREGGGQRREADRGHWQYGPDARVTVNDPGDL